MSAAELKWSHVPGFPSGRAFDAEHQGTTWRLALVLHDEPTGFAWLDDEPADGWRLFKAEGGRMQPVAGPFTPLDTVFTHAAIRICPRGVHR